MALDFYEMAVRIIVALVAGALIGYERSYRGRARQAFALMRSFVWLPAS